MLILMNFWLQWKSWLSMTILAAILPQSEMIQFDSIAAGNSTSCFDCSNTSAFSNAGVSVGCSAIRNLQCPTSIQDWSAQSWNSATLFRKVPRLKLYPERIRFLALKSVLPIRNSALHAVAHRNFLNYRPEVFSMVHKSGAKKPDTGNCSH